MLNVDFLVKMVRKTKYFNFKLPFFPIETESACWECKTSESYDEIKLVRTPFKSLAQFGQQSSGFRVI